jgi:hypothetical protein
LPIALPGVMADRPYEQVVEVPTSLEGRPSLPDQIAAARPFEPLDVALFAAFGTLAGVLFVIGATLVLGEMAAYLYARTERGSRRG